MKIQVAAVPRPAAQTLTRTHTAGGWRSKRAGAHEAHKAHKARGTARGGEDAGGGGGSGQRAAASGSRVKLLEHYELIPRRDLTDDQWRH